MTTRRQQETEAHRHIDTPLGIEESISSGTSGLGCSRVLDSGTRDADRIGAAGTTSSSARL